MMTTMKQTAFYLLLSIYFGLVMLNAQNTGKITGAVRDAATGEALIGVNIMLEGTRYGAVSDFSGEFMILKIPSGTYTLTASILGYSKAITTNVRVLNDLTTAINFTLNQSAISQDEVIITAETPLIKKDLTATESRVTAEEIQNLPVQNLDQLITLQAGVSKDAGGGIHIRGGRSSEVSYLVNGVSVTDDFSRTQAFSVETESIQELQVISGTFNAEYGNAMSGVINVVTKTGGSKFRSSIEAWSGDFVSSRNDIFWGIDEFSPAANYNFQGTISGPLLSEDVSYYLSMRRYYTDGYLYGVNAYSPQGRTIATDSAFVAMNSNSRWSGQATFDWRASDAVTLKIDVLGSMEANRFYSHIYRLNPNGAGKNETRGISIIPKLTYQFSQNTFQELTFAYRFNDNRSRLYDSPDDPRYVHSDSLSATGYHFRMAGTNLNRFERNTKSLIAKWDLTSQLNKENLFKMGVEWQSDKLFYENINLVPAKDATGRDIVPFIPSIEGIEKPNHDMFERQPVKFAAYIQNKIELQSMIINAGIRFEMFDPAGRIPSDPEDPDIYNPFKPEHRYHDLNNDGTIGLAEQTPANAVSVSERDAYWYTKVKQKIAVSPRLGIAYPITDRGIIRFSYGIFQQVPEYGQLYIGDQFKLQSAQQGIQGPFGNNDLKPQRTTIYEFGLQQQVSDEIAVDVTAFYRDIRDWISSGQAIPTFLAGLSYSKRVNRDFANVKGITLSVTKRHADKFSFGIDYTYQVADGTNSSPDEEFFSQQDGSEPTKTLTPLGWDQTHTLNGNFMIGTPELGASLIASMNTGQPYTPTRIGGAYTGRNVLSGLAENSRRKPIIARFDVEAFKILQFEGVNVQIFVRVLNVFDSANPVNVWGDTGEAGFTLQKQELSDYDPGWFDDPTFYSEPRSIIIGTKFSL